MSKIGTHANLLKLLEKLDKGINHALPLGPQWGADKLKRAMFGVDTFKRHVETSFRNSAKGKLYECTEESASQAIIMAAQVGLAVGTKRNHAYLVPKKATCVYMQGWRGLVHLARSSGLVTGAEARIVYEGDFFDYELGTNQYLKHKPCINKKDRGEPVNVYAIMRMRQGPDLLEVMDFEEVERIGKKHGGFLWNEEDNRNELRRKTPIRRICKYGPDEMLPEASYAALDHEDRTIGGQVAASTAASTEALVEELDAKLEKSKVGRPAAGEVGGASPDDPGDFDGITDAEAGALFGDE